MGHNASVPIHWRKLAERYHLLGSKCDNCSKNFFPARVLCNDCRRDTKMTPWKFCGKGTIESFTLITSPPEAYAKMAPYIVAIIKLKEGPNIVGQMVSCDTCDVKIGDPVTSVFRKVIEAGTSGVIKYGYKFAPETSKHD